MAGISAVVCFIAVLLCFKTSTMGSKKDELMGSKEDELKPAQSVSASAQHRTDSLTMLLLLGLLLLTILTVWLFKHRRFRFVHETGLSMMYGLIMGAIIRYTSKPVHEPDSAMALIMGNRTYYADDAPSILYVNFSMRNSSSFSLRQYDLGAVIEAPKQSEPPLEKTVTFDPEIFFNVMLPVIIFEAGYSMKRRHFFKNLGAILMYAIVGTTVSCLVVGGVLYGLTRLMYDISFGLNDCLFFGAIISATDPVTVLAIFNDLNVDVDLYALVFGESVLNDAVAIVLSESVEMYGQLSTDAFNIEALFKSFGRFVGVFSGAFAIGGLFGAATAFLTKFTKVGEFPLLESGLFFLMSYSSFQAGEASDLSGIVAVLFCGITQAHYTYNNLSPESKERTKQLFELANFLAENFVFLYIGVSVFTLQPLQWHAGFILSSFLAIIAGRMMNIYPLSFLLNLGRSNKIRPNFQHMMMFSGLRGAVAFALAIRKTDTEANQHMASATMVIVMVTVVLFGGFTTPMLQWLQIRVGVEEDSSNPNLAQQSTVRNAMTGQRQYSSMDGNRSGSAQATNSTVSQTGSHGVGQSPAPSRSNLRSDKAWLVAKWHNFDINFMKPLLTNSRPTLIDTMPKCCMHFSRLFTTQEQLSQGGGGTDRDSDTDMIIDDQQLTIGAQSDQSSLDQGSTSRKHILQMEEGSKGSFVMSKGKQALPWTIGIHGSSGDRV